MSPMAFGSCLGYKCDSADLDRLRQDKIVNNQRNGKTITVLLSIFGYFRENTLESVDETPSSGEDDDSEMLKRTPLWRRRRRRRRRGWFRKLKDKVKKHGRRICGWLKNSTHKGN